MVKKIIKGLGILLGVLTGVTPFNRKLNDVMPSKYYKNMTDVELKALWAYIKAIPVKAYAQR